MKRINWARSGMGIACMLTCLLLSLTVAAQTGNGTVLRGKDVTEQKVLDALTPEDPVDEAVPVQSRGIRATIRNTPVGGASKPHKKPSAILLITFDTNSTELTARSKGELDVVAAAMRNDRLKEFAFEVEGHADLRGTPTANLSLSQQRAEVARRYLIDEHQIPESRLRAVGKGDSEPMNTHNVAAPENRRVAVTTVAR